MAATRKTKAVQSATQEQMDPVTAVSEEKELRAKDIDPHQIVVVRNGFNGVLVYTSSRTGETFLWQALGDEQEMELGEVRNAKNSAKTFFINNWFMFDDEYQWVIDYIGARQFYKDSINIDQIDTLFEMTPEQIEEKVSKLSGGQKQTVAYKARQMIVDGQIDSRKVVMALEKSLGIELTEK